MPGEPIEYGSFTVRVNWTAPNSFNPFELPIEPTPTPPPMPSPQNSGKKLSRDVAPKTKTSGSCSYCHDEARYTGGRLYLNPENNRWYCVTCVKACVLCNMWQFRHDCEVQGEQWLRNIHDMGAVCNECLRGRETVTCGNCSELTIAPLRPFPVIPEFLGSRFEPARRSCPNGICSRCFNAFTNDIAQRVAIRQQAALNVIGEYHQDASERNISLISSPWVRSHSERHFGVELEVEVISSNSIGDRRKEAAKRILDSVNVDSAGILADKIKGKRLLYCERDASLRNGFELISAAMGLDDQRSLWKKALERENVKGLVSHQTETCGLHVHMSRKSLTKLQISKMVAFLNHRDNKDLVFNVARRHDHHYCMPKTVTVGTAQRILLNKYDMLNLLPPRTVEFRIFKGSLNVRSVIAAIEFCNAVADFCKVASNANLTTKAFLDYLVTPEMRQDTEYLRDYLAERAQRNPAYVKIYSKIPAMPEKSKKQPLVSHNNPKEG